MMDGPVQGSRECPCSVPCGFWLTDGPVRGRWHDQDWPVHRFIRVLADGRSDLGWMALPTHRALQVRANRRFNSGRSGLLALRALQDRVDRRSGSGRTARPELARSPCHVDERFDWTDAPIQGRWHGVDCPHNMPCGCGRSDGWSGSGRMARPGLPHARHALQVRA